MTVLCENCQTANRDRAMFCIGCAGKLPAFAATGPSLLQSLGEPRPRPKANPVTAAARAGQAIVAGRAPRALVLAVLLLGATVLALASWIGFGPTRAAPVATVAPVAPVAPVASVAPLVPPATTPVAQTAPLQALPVDASLAAGESTVPPAAVTPQVVESPAPVRRVEPQRAPQRVASVSGASNGRGAADPRAGCEQLFFVLAARCEARHCDEAAYTRHPRCTVVRAQRDRDLARRNLTQ